jgi:hypothetical protein
MNRRIFIPSLVVLALAIGAAFGAPLAGAAKVRCLVGDRGAQFSTLQAAQDSASAGDTLVVRGNCVGSTSISKNLSIVGVPSIGRATLSGGGAGAVVQIPRYSGLVVSISGVTITGATGGTYGGIFNGGSLTLNDVAVSGNSADTGAGIFNAGTLVLNGSAVRGNASTGDGGGIDNGGSLTLNRSVVQGNSATNGGGIMNFGGTVTLTGSVVAGNRAAQAAGGIFNQGGLTLSNSTVGSNKAATAGGIYNATCSPGFGYSATGATHVAGNAPDNIVTGPAC